MKSYLIVGQGIAGSILAWHLIKAGHSVTIVDQNHHESSSMISAGIINPITGQRLAVMPQYDLLYSKALQTYSDMGAQLGGSFFIPKPIIRIIRSPEELKKAHQIESSPLTKAYIAGIYGPGRHGKSIHDPLGSIVIAQGGYLQTQLLLNALKKFFIYKQMLIKEQLSYNDLIIKDDGVEWKSKNFDAVIFCEGFKASQNPWFKDLPYMLAKGEILRVSFESVTLPDAILCQQQWCLPAQDNSYLVGSTYDRDNINTLTTGEGKSEILDGLRNFIRSDVSVLEHYAGVRPIMIDTKPVAKMHPSIPRIGIFNGFASKGTLWAPHYAEEFIKIGLCAT